MTIILISAQILRVLAWPFRTVLRLDDKLRVTDILEESKSRVEEGCDNKQERD